MNKKHIEKRINYLMKKGLIPEIYDPSLNPASPFFRPPVSKKKEEE